MKRHIIWSCFFLLGFTCCQSPTNKLFEKLAKEQTKRCPVVIDEYLTLDSVVYLIDKNINQYYYSARGSYDNIQAINNKIEMVREAIIQEVKNEVEMKRYKEYNTTLEYIYHSQRDGSVLTRIVILPTEY